MATMDRTSLADSSRAAERVACLNLVLLVSLAGCGGEETWIPEIKDPAYPVRGKVLLPNGSPLKSGRIEFYPVKEPGLLAYGEIAPDGSFSLKTREPGDGAIPGDYKVRILIPERREYSRYARYRDEDGSQLRVTVKAEPNRLPPFRLR